MKIGAIIFDFDGVLVDSERLHWRLYQEVLAPLGGGFSWAEYTSRWIALHDAGCMEAVFEDRGIDIAPERIEDLVSQKARLFEERVTQGQLELFPGVPEFLARAAKRFPLAICSGALRAEIAQVLSVHGIARHFCAIVGAEDCAHHKPEPEPYERALEALNQKRPAGDLLAPTDCLVFEDTPDGIRAAKEAGMICVGVLNSYPPEALEKADAVLGSFEGTKLDAVLGLLGE